MLSLDRLRQTPAALEPFPHLVATDLLSAESLQQIQNSYPDLPGPGSFPLDTLTCNDSFAQLISELQSSDLADILGDKLQVNLSPYPTMLTVRGYCRESDGKIHADSVEKVVTVLLYLNTDWQHQGGCLELLRSKDSLQSSFLQVQPQGGTMVAFRCDPNAWHGHAPYAGPRRTLQLNWVSSRAWLQRERLRHRLSAAGKKLRRWLKPQPKPEPATRSR